MLSKCDLYRRCLYKMLRYQSVTCKCNQRPLQLSFPNPALKQNWCSAMTISKLLIALSALLSTTSAQTTCSGSLRPSYSAIVASGYQIGLVATGLARPRGLEFDKAGHLLVVEAPAKGDPTISALTFEDGGSVCVAESSRKTVVRGQGVSRHPLRTACIRLMLGPS